MEILYKTASGCSVTSEQLSVIKINVLYFQETNVDEEIKPACF